MRCFKINSLITKYSLGNPFNTESVVLNGVESQGSITKFLHNNNNKIFIYNLKENDIVYGLGENVRGLNKRGWIYESFCSDDFSHTPEKRSLYGSHNFILIHGEIDLGIFVDHPGRVKFDIGFSKYNELKIILPDDNFNIYIIEGKDLEEITKEFRGLIGESYVPPKWAFGFQQSRWSYRDKDEVLNVIRSFRNSNMPIDCVYLDIDYMEDFKNFTIDKNSFPNFEEVVEEARNLGVRLIPIIDAGCKIQEGYDIYEEGIKGGYYCKDEEGNPFIAAVWPGKVHFPDFLNKDARLWFGKKYKFLVDKGIEGFWNDMNEPAIFYSEKSLKKAFKKISEAQGKNLDIYSFFHVKDTFPGLSNSMEDYKSFYHSVDGQLVRHDKIHNLYGYNMTRSASEGLEVIESNKRFLLFSRASHIGMHRYGGIWTGDNASWWEHLELNIKMMPNLNMCGFLYIGADTGGFGSDSTEDLVIRWSQFSLFTPLFRNHSAMGTRHQEPYAFNNESTDILRNLLELRYALVPYLYSEFMKGIINNNMYFKPLTFNYKDKFSKRVENQLLLGDSLMIAPIYEQNSNGRYVYLPEPMLLWTTSKYDDDNYKVLEEGHHYIEASLKQIPIFVRKNKILVLARPAQNVENINTKELNVLAFIEDQAEYNYYTDDGCTKGYKTGDYKQLEIIIEDVKGDYNINVENNDLKLIEKLNITIFNINGKRLNKEISIS